MALMPGNEFAADAANQHEQSLLDEGNWYAARERLVVGEPQRVE